MSKPKKPAAAKQAVTEEMPAPKAAATKTMKKAKAQAKPKAPTADEVMPKARASEELVVFAFRLSADEREEIHAAAGSARASRFVRAVALAAARRDVPTLQAIMLEAQKGTVAS